MQYEITTHGEVKIFFHKSSQKRYPINTEEQISQVIQEIYLKKIDLDESNKAQALQELKEL